MLTASVARAQDVREASALSPASRELVKQLDPRRDPRSLGFLRNEGET
jgi:hypothetical protein